MASGFFCSRRRRDGRRDTSGIEIGLRQIAEHEDGLVSGFDAAGMQAIGTEASVHRIARLLLRTGHEIRIAQCAAVIVRSVAQSLPEGIADANCSAIALAD